VETPKGFKVRGDRDHPSSLGRVCVKGATVIESIQKDRLLHPMWRESLDDEFKRVSWDFALDLIAAKVRETIDTRGVDSVCIYGSGQLVTEDYYTAQKLLKGCLGSNNFDANSRLCMSSAVSAYVQSFGTDGPPCCYDDLEQTDCGFLIGTNTAECHPIVFNRFLEHKKRNPQVKLIVVDPRETLTAKPADLHLAINPGTDIDLLNGIAYLLLENNAINRQFIEQHTYGFYDYELIFKHYSPEMVARRCGIAIEDLKLAATYWGESSNVLSLWSMGINQSQEGTAKARTLINLHLMTGQIGRAGSGPFSLTGQPNAMGGREAGGLAHLLPGYRSVKNADHRAEVEQSWQLPAGQISPQPGLNAWEMIEALERDALGVFWIAATNPVVSMPDLNRTKAALRRSPFTVYQEAYNPTETTAFAHLLLPAMQWSEKRGTMTNSERVVTLSQGFQASLGEAKEDWWVFAQVGQRLGFEEQFSFDDVEAVHREFADLTRDRPCDMTGMSYDLLRTHGPQQWPYPIDATPSTEPKRLYTDLRFNTPDGRAHFVALHSRGLAEPPDPDFPLVLTIGRLYGHWHTQTRTGRIEKIEKMHPDPFLEIHPRDAANLEIEEGNLLEVRSRRGRCELPAKITRSIAPGTVFAPMHWGALWSETAEVNVLTHPEACPDSAQPELKACAVAVSKIAPTAVSRTPIATQASPSLTPNPSTQNPLTPEVARS
jgi:ferredoxin-nitrate reductase